MRKWYWLAAVVLVATAGCGQDWQTQSSPDGKYSINMPGSPRKETRNLGTIGFNALVSEQSDGVYMVAYSDIPPGTPVSLDGAVDGILRSQNGKLLRSTSVIIRGHVGKEFEIELSQPKKGFACGRLLFFNNRLYQILAMGERHRLSDPDVQKFLNSFRLQGK
jgi:hypothetical protein